MRFLSWIPRWVVALLLLANVPTDSHMLHYLHLKKFLTAVAFARALGKRPTVLPIPVPIPIPIAQNEVIRIPVNGGKTMILDGNKGGGKGVGLPHIFGGGSHGGIDYTGSSSYGYAMPGVSNLSSMKASDSNVVNLASALGASGGSNGSPRIIVLGGQGSSGNGLSSLMSGGGPSVIRLNDIGGSNIQMGASGLSSLVSGGGPSVIRLNDIGGSNIQMGASDMNFGINSFGFGGISPMNSFGDLDSAFSVKSPLIYRRPFNVYSDKPRRRYPMTFRGRRTNNKLTGSSERQTHNAPESSNEEKHKKPIPVGEKFTYRP